MTLKVRVPDSGILLLFNACDLLGQFNLVTQVRLPEHEDSLGLGRPGAVHGLNYGSPTGNGFDETEEANPMFRGNVGHTL